MVGRLVDEPVSRTSLDQDLIRLLFSRGAAPFFIMPHLTQKELDFMFTQLGRQKTPIEIHQLLNVKRPRFDSASLLPTQYLISTHSVPIPVPIPVPIRFFPVPNWFLLKKEIQLLIFFILKRTFGYWEKPNGYWNGYWNGNLMGTD